MVLLLVVMVVGGRGYRADGGHKILFRNWMMLLVLLVLLVLVSCDSNFCCSGRCYFLYSLRLLYFLALSVLFVNFFPLYPVGVMMRNGLVPPLERLKLLLLVKPVGLLLQHFFLSVREVVLVVVVGLYFYYLTRLLLLLILLLFLVSLQDVGDKERCCCSSRSGCGVAVGGCLRLQGGPGAAARRAYCCGGGCR